MKNSRDFIGLLGLFFILMPLITSCNKSVSIETTLLPEPNFNGVYQLCDKSDRIRVNFISKSINGIIDDEVWIEKYAEGMNKCVTYNFTPGGNKATEQLNRDVPIVCNGLYRRSIDVQDGYNVIYYGKKSPYQDGEYGVDPTLVLITESSVNNVRYALDFSKFSVSSFSNNDYFVDISVYGAQIENDILYACVSHSTYAASSAGYNAYLVAIDLRTQTVKWVTKPLTCNSDFIIYKDVIFIC